MSDSGKPRGSAEKELFFEALEKHSAEERAAFLDAACAGDPARRAKIGNYSGQNRRAMLVTVECGEDF